MSPLSKSLGCAAAALLAVSMTTAAGPAVEPPAARPPLKSAAVQRPAGLPRIDPFDPHRLTMNGELFFPLGFYGGSMTMTNDHPAWGGDPEAAFRYYLRTLYNYGGLNYFRAWTHWGASRPQHVKLATDWDFHMTHPYQRSDLCCANDGGNRFDLDQFNPAYFESIVGLMTEARSLGLVGQIMFFDCWHAHNDASKGPLVANITQDYYHGANNINGADARTGGEWTAGDLHHPQLRLRRVAERQRDYVFELIHYLEDFDNIIWEVCNENRDNEPAFNTFVYDQIQLRDSRHLVMPIDLEEHRYVAGHHTPSDSNAKRESIAAMHDRLVDPQFGWDEPLITDNDCCAPEPPGIDAGFRRKKAWAALTAGAHTDYFIGDLPAEAQLMDDPDISLSMIQYSYILDTLHSLRPNLLGAVPCDDRVEGAGGAESWALCRPGEDYVIYLPQGGSVTVTDLPAKYLATWINPRNNQRFQELRTAGSGPLVAPDTQDWGLHIRCGHAGFQAPLSDPFAVPTRIEAERFDCGGQGVAFHDSDRGNNGGTNSSFRFSDVDLEPATDAGGGHQVGWIEPGEWLEYTIQPAASGSYQPLVRLAGAGTGGSIRFRFELDGEPVGGTVTTPGTAGFTSWKTVAGPELPLLAYGTDRLRLVAVAGGFNLNWIDFGAAGALPSGALIADRFTNTSSARDVGDPLHGAATQLGAQTWAATAGLGFGPGAMTNLTAAASHVAGVPFGPAVFTRRTATVEALLDATRANWIGIGFSRSATGGYWSDGQVWAYLRYNGDLVVHAGGTAHTLYSGRPAAYQATMPNRVKLEYDRTTNAVRLWLNDAPIPLTTADLDSFSLLPEIAHAGVHAYKAGGFQAPSQLFVDDFRVDQAGPLALQTLTVPCLADAYVAQDAPNVNFGGSSVLAGRFHLTGHSRRSFLRFQVPAVPGTIVAATLRIRTRNNPVADASVFRMTGLVFNEHGITWSNHLNQTTSWTFLRSLADLAANTFHEIDVTEAVTGSGTLDLAVSSSQDLAGQEYHSRETAFAPTLVITYAP